MNPLPAAPRVHNKYHRDAPTEAVYIGRGGPWGNPFVIGPVCDGKHGDRDEVIARFRTSLLADPERLFHVRSELAGKPLVCFCAPVPCHGDVLLEVANCDLATFKALLADAIR